MNKLICFTTAALVSVTVWAAPNDKNGILSDASHRIRSDLAVEAYITMCSALTNGINGQSAKLSALINTRNKMLSSSEILDKEFAYALTCTTSLLLINSAIKDIDLAQRNAAAGTKSPLNGSKKTILTLWKANADFAATNLPKTVMFEGGVFTREDIFSGAFPDKLSNDQHKRFQELFQAFEIWPVFGFGRDPSQEKSLVLFMSIFQELLDLQYFMAEYEKGKLCSDVNKNSEYFMKLPMPESVRIDDGMENTSIKVTCAIDRYCGVDYESGRTDESFCGRFTMAFGPFMLNHDCLSADGRKGLQWIEKQRQKNHEESERNQVQP